MVIDGKAIAADILRGVREQAANYNGSLRLSVLTCAPTFATKNYLDIKRRRAKEAGISLNIIELDATCSTDEAVTCIKKEAGQSDGLVVQLPFPSHINTENLLAALPARYDVDVIGTEAESAFERGESPVLPPVVGAIAAIAERHNISFDTKQVVVVGEGRLVGRPAAVWAAQQGATVEVIDASTSYTEHTLQQADIIILGAGSPGLLQPHMVRDGVAVFDAGTSELGGKLVGDADPQVAEKASLSTPVPGGIGPIAIAKLFENLLTLLSNRVTK